MTLLTDIKKDQLQARKDKNVVKTATLTTLISEAAMVGKNDGARETTDNEVVAVIQKFIKNNDELIKVSDSESPANIAAKNENLVLSEYLPKQLTEEEILNIAQQCIETLDEISPRAMGTIMKTLKEKHAGQYDGNLASKLIKELLNG